MARVTLKKGDVREWEGLRPGEWAMHDDAHLPVMKCPAGHSGTLRTHKVEDNGDVNPSVVCNVDGCTFHEFVTLDGWTKR